MASRSDVTYTTVNTDLGQCETGLSDQEYAEDKSFPYLQIPWKERVPQIAVHLAFFCVYSLVSLVILIHGLPGPARSCPPQPEQYSAKGEAHTVYCMHIYACNNVDLLTHIFNQHRQTK